MQIENQSNRGSEQLPPQEPEKVDAQKLTQSIDALRKANGTAPTLPQSMTQAEMSTALEKMREDANHANFAEVMTYNNLVYRKNSLQREAELQSSASTVDRKEFATVNQTETYFEYMRAIVDHVLQTSDEYMTLRDRMPNVPLEISRQERELQVFHDELTDALKKRVDFTNAALAAYLLSVQRDRKGNVALDQQTLMNQAEAMKKKIDPIGKAILDRQDSAGVRIHSNSLDQKIIELIADKGHLPGQALLNLQAERYRIILDQQKAVVRDGGLAKERAEWEKLKVKNAKAKNGEGEPLDDREAQRFLELQELLSRAKPTYTKLSSERRDMSQNMIGTAEKLASFHEKAEELLILQNQFKSADKTVGATPSNPDDTPPLVAAKIDEVTEMRSQFHRERISAFGARFEEEVLKEGLPEKIEDFSNKTGREFVRNISNRLAGLVTWPAPGKFGIRDFLKERLAGPLNDAMGWPAEKMDMKFEELTAEERNEVMSKARSIADAVREFDRSKITRMQNSLVVLQALPPTKQALGGEPKDPLPELPPEGLTKENMDALIREHGLPTVTLLALRQMNEAVGDRESGFIGETAKFTDKVNDVVDVHFETADALFRQSEDWKKVMYLILAAAVGGALAVKYWKQILRSPFAAVAAAEGQMAVTKGVSQGLIAERESRIMEEVLLDLESLQKGTDRAGNKLSPELTKKFVSEAATRLFSSILQQKQLAAASMNPLVSGYEEAMPNPLNVFEAFVEARDILEQKGFPNVLSFPPDFSIPSDLSKASERAREVAAELRISSPSRPATLETLLEDAKSAGFRQEYGEFEKKADRRKILTTMGEIFRMKYDVVMELEAPANHPNAIVDLWRWMWGTKPGYSDMVTAERFKELTTQARTIGKLPQRELLLMAEYLNRHPPTDLEILQWYKGTSVRQSGVQRNFGPERKRGDMHRMVLRDWFTIESFAKTLEPEKK